MVFSGMAILSLESLGFWASYKEIAALSMKIEGIVLVVGLDKSVILNRIPLLMSVLNSAG